MKSEHKTVAFSILLASSLLSVPVSAYAENIFFDGTDTSLLRHEPITNTDRSLFPNSKVNNQITVDIVNVTRIDGSIFGGIADTSNISNNTVVIRKINIGGDIYGSFNNAGVLYNNTVILDGSNLSGANAILAAYSSYGKSTNNTVNIINNSQISLPNNSIAGSLGFFGNDTLNKSNAVNISDSAVTAFLIIGAQGSQAHNNKVNIINSIVTGSIQGAIGDNGDTAGNEINIVNSSVNSNVIIAGNNLQVGQSWANKISIDSSHISTAYIIGGLDENDGASNNKLSIINSKVDIAGLTLGSLPLMIAGGAVQTSTGNANFNTVSIGSESTINGTIYGGYSLNGNANNNTVNIYGTPDLTNASLYGGGINNGGNAISGNSLNLATKVTARQVGSFSFYNFALPSATMPLDTLLNLTSTTTDLGKSKVQIVSIGDSQYNWQVGDSIKLINNDNGLSSNDTDLTANSLRKGFKTYIYQLSRDTNSIYATFTRINPHETAYGLLDGRIAGLGFLNNSADFVVSAGVQKSLQNSSKLYDIFAAINYGNTSIKSNSKIDMHGKSLLVGASRKLSAKNSNLVFGAFLEAGWSDYNSNNHAEAIVNANGKNNYQGLGLTVKQSYNSGIYAEGNLRIGKVSTKYNNGMPINYNIRSAYYGFNIGLGKTFNVSKHTDLDAYVKYFGTHQAAASTIIDHDKLNFNALNSNRLRLGTRININQVKALSGYIGLAYEHEFSALSKANYIGTDICPNTARGGSAFYELGVTYRPVNQPRFSMDFALNGYLGKRQGLGANLALNWSL